MMQFLSEQNCFYLQFLRRDDEVFHEKKISSRKSYGQFCVVKSLMRTP